MGTEALSLAYRVPGGLREVTADKMRQRRPERIVEYAIQRDVAQDQAGAGDVP